jgi:ethanolamine utilization microcompartment shell protein EutL
MKTVIAAAGLLAILAMPAFAAEDCAASLTRIDDAMKSATVDEATKARLTELVDKAKASNDNGEAEACSASAMEALALLGMK